MSGDKGDAASGCAMFWKSVSVFGSESLPHDGCPICVCRLGLYRETHIPPVTDTVHATKQRCRGSVRHYISRVLQSPLPRDSPLHDGECGSIRRSLPRDAWVTSINLVDTYFPSTEVTENVFEFRLGTPYTNSGHCRSAFLQHLGYSTRLWQRSKCW